MSFDRIFNLSLIVEEKECQGRVKIGITDGFAVVDFSFSCATPECQGKIWGLRVLCGHDALPGTHDFWVFRDPVALPVRCEKCMIVSVPLWILNETLSKVVADEIRAHEMNPQIVYKA